MSKITNDGLTRSGTECFIALVYPYGNSGHQSVKLNVFYDRVASSAKFSVLPPG